MPRKRGKREPTAKWKVIKELLEAIREKPRSIGEIREIKKWKKEPGKEPEEVKQFPQPRTTINNWVAEPLEVLGLIYYNPKDRRYYPSESKRPAFGTKEYELAVEHARLVIDGDPERGVVGVTTYPMHILIQFLATKDRFCKEFLRHIETAPSYHKLYTNLEEYRKVLKKRAPLIRRIYRENLGVDPPKGDDLDINFTIPHPLWLAKGMGDHMQPRIANKNLQGIDAERDVLFKEIAGELADIFRQVDMGSNPLDGFCNSCRHLRVTIIE